LLSKDSGLQSSSHYNLGNTLYQRGEGQQGDDKKLIDWANALQHYEETLKLQPQNKEAKDNYEFVKRKIEELKKKKEEQKSQDQSSPPNPDQKQSDSGSNSQQQQEKIEPSEAAKRAKAEADKAVQRREFTRALTIMQDQLRIDATTRYYQEYMERLGDINGVKNPLKF
jgi:hypothetical protein